MKIAFITSCLEPGRDGVGDYTTLLAAECRKRGHDAIMIALNDPHAHEERPAEGSLHLSSFLPWDKRVKKAREFLSAFNPDFVSLQFVSYGFHPKGMDFMLAQRLQEIVRGCRVHIMFHELWIGAQAGAPFKERLVGAIQRALLLRMVRALKPRAVYTSNVPYAGMLNRRGIPAKVLPLFGAIPPNLIMPLPREDEIVLGMFGAIPPVWPPQPLFSLLQATGKKITIIHAGGMGGGESLWEKLEREHGAVIQFKKLGRQPPKRISQFLGSEIDFGIATAPWELVGKSAATAAMLEHGLPVIVNRDDWHLAGEPPSPAISPLLIKMDRKLPENLASAQRGELRWMLPVVASLFLGDLERAL